MGPRIADGKDDVPADAQKRSRHADDVQTSQNCRIRSLDFHPGLFQKIYAALGHARLEQVHGLSMPYG
jgi:hypothetical protein